MLEVLEKEGLLSLIKTQFKDDLKRESCGIIYRKNGELSFLKVKNMSGDPENHFLINPAVIIDYSPLVIVHSHVDSCAAPSQLDISSSNELCIPYLIYSIRFDEFYLYENISV